MSSREELLAGVASLNRRKFDAREDCEMFAEDGREVVEGVAPERESGTTGVPEPCVPTDKSDLSGDEESLEELLESQVASKSAVLREIESQITDSRDRTERLVNVFGKVSRELRIAEEVLRNEFGNPRGACSTESTVPEEGPCSGDETEESV